ncbi:MAG: tetratricopeptide repeat protein [Polyangiaceae bacterium]
MSERGASFPPPGFGTIDRRAVLVGRAAELRVLDESLRAVRDDGHARTVTLVGANGIGKTRLVRDFLSKQRSTVLVTPRIFRGSARDQGAAYDVFARVLRARFGIVEGMDPEEAKRQVRNQCAEVLEDRKVGDVVYFLGQILELSFQDSPLIQAVAQDPLEAVRLRRAVIRRFLEADAQPKNGGPLVLVFDDLHWARDDSLELLNYLMETVTAPILFVCIARPELMARNDNWTKTEDARHRLVELSPLSEHEAAAVMHDLLAPVGPEIELDELIEAATTLAGGNPALLEQMVRIFLDMGVLEVVDELAEEETWRVHLDKLEEVRLPLTIEDAVQARIAALTSEERELLERAAIMGGVFWLGGLVAIERLSAHAPPVWSAGSLIDTVTIRERLQELVDRDYILKLPDSTFAGDEEFVFKHNLEREALASMSATAVARKYHGAIADWLSFKEYVRSHEEYVAMLARHREKAGAKWQAASAYLEAADVARARYANAKAAEYYATGLGLLQDIGPEADPNARLLALHHYGDVLQALGRTEDALKAFREMLARSYKLDQRTKGGAAHGRIGRLYRDTGELEDATMHLDAALALFEEMKDERGIASTVDDIGKLYWLRGDYHKALDFTQRALAMRRRLGDRRSIALSLNNLGLVYQDSGQYVQALDAFEQALRIRREIGDLVGVSISLNNLGTVAQDQREDKRALTLFQEAHEVALETGDRNRIALVLTNLGETHNRLGDAVAAIKYLKQAEELADELGDKMGLAEAMRGLGKAYLAQREYTKARENTARAVEIFTEVQSKFHIGVSLRSLGEVTAAASAGGESAKSARGYLVKAIQIFEEIGNEVELARSCRAYADLLRNTQEYQTDPNTIREAAAYSKRAEEIFARLKISSFGLEPDAFFAAR